MKKASPLVICVFIYILNSTSTLFAQGFKDRYFHSYGFTSVLDYTSTPVMEYTGYAKAYDEGGDIEYKGLAKGHSISALAVFYTPRINLYQSGNDMSVSINTPLKISLSRDYISFTASTTDSRVTDPGMKEVSGTLDGLFSVGFPVYVCLNTGMTSTYNSEKQAGFTFGLGVDNIISTFWAYPTKDEEKFYGRWKSQSLAWFYSMPSMNVGYRFWRGTKGTEINLKVSYSGTDTKHYGSTTMSSTAFAACLSWHTFLNY